MPCRGPDSVNPFYSDKVQSELRLQELRPGNLPVDGSDGESSFLAPLTGSAAQKNPRIRKGCLNLLGRVVVEVLLECQAHCNLQNMGTAG